MDNNLIFLNIRENGFKKSETLQCHMIDITVLELLGHEAHNKGLEAAKVQLIKKTV